MTSFCASCGTALSDGARYCSVCGTAVSNPLPHAINPARPLARSRAGKKIAGVCQGLALHFGWDVSITRIIAVVLALVTFPIGPIAYVLCWVILPEDALALPAVSSFHPAP